MTSVILIIGILLPGPPPPKPVLRYRPRIPPIGGWELRLTSSDEEVEAFHILPENLHLIPDWVAKGTEKWVVPLEVDLGDWLVHHSRGVGPVTIWSDISFKRAFRSVRIEE